MQLLAILGFFDGKRANASQYFRQDLCLYLNIAVNINADAKLVYSYDYNSIAKHSPKPQLKPNWGLRLTLLSLYPATPTSESIIQTQINIDVKGKVVDHNG